MGLPQGVGFVRTRCPFHIAGTRRILLRGPSFLACSIDLQRNENDEEPEIERLIHIEKDPGDRQGSEEVDRVANSRIEALSDEGLSLRADGERAT